jgi:RNA polymerase sigma-70 factor (ECF subfamily)
VIEATDETLAIRAGEGCRASFSALLERHYDRVYRLAWRWTGKPERAEDIAQDVCVKLASAVRSYRGDAKFSTWLHRIAYTTAMDHMRAGQRMVSVEPSEIMRLSDELGEVQATDEEADHEELWRAVRTLPPQQRDAILLVYGEELSHAQAGDIMGCAEKTVSWHIHAAKKRLKILLEAVG